MVFSLLPESIVHSMCLVIVQAVLTSDRSTNPVYVSVGHKISQETATRLVLECSRSRIPEPVRVVCYHIWCDTIFACM